MRSTYAVMVELAHKMSFADVDMVLRDSTASLKVEEKQLLNI